MLKLVRCALALEDCQMVVRRWLQHHRHDDLSHAREQPGNEIGRRYTADMNTRSFTGAVIEIVTDDSWADEIIARITEAHKDSLIGGRAIQVFPVEESYRIRDGFMDMR